ncbi:MAG: two-component regulator propeller domain-containing protein [Melioribacteraceae bacterium]
MNHKLYSIIIMFFIFVGSLSAQIKDTLFVQEYHETFLLENETQNDVKTIIVDKQNNIWVGTFEGLFVLDKSNKKWIPKLSKDNQGPINDLFSDDDGKIWIAAWNGLYCGDIICIDKIQEINSPTSVVNKIHNSIIAVTTEKIWKKTNSKWESEELVSSRLVRDIIQDSENGFYIATGKGLYHKTENGMRLFQNEDELVSDNIFGLDYSDDNKLWIGGLGGITVYENNKRINSYIPKDGIPNGWIRCVKKAPDDKMWIGTDFGISRFDGKNWTIRNSKRWLVDDNVRDIAFDSNGNAWIATANGVSAIKNKMISLADKEKYYKKVMEKRHVRKPYLVEKCRFLIPGDTTNWLPKDDDNDGQYTSMYLVMESLRYAVTKDPVAKLNAKKAFEALKFLQIVTETNGFFARTVIPSDWKEMADPNEIIDDREWSKRIIEDPRLNRLEQHWVLSKDKKWLWKRGTSSDEVTGHMYGYLYYFDLVADQKEKEIVKDHVTKIVNYIIDGGYVFNDIDGNHTEWGVWAPEYLNEKPDWATERGINSVEILSYLKLAYHVSGNEFYQKEYYKLWNDYNYKNNVVNAKTTLPSWRTYIDDELLALAYPALFMYESDPQILEYYKKSLDNWYSAFKHDDNPYFYFTYNIFANNKLHLDRSIFLLQDNPLDLLRWKIDNSKREDLTLTRIPILEDLQTNKLVPPSERGIMRWDNNPWRAIQGDGGLTESDGVYWRLAYWLGRFHKLIE